MFRIKLTYRITNVIALRRLNKQIQLTQTPQNVGYSVFFLWHLTRYEEHDLLRTTPEDKTGGRTIGRKKKSCI